MTQVSSPEPPAEGDPEPFNHGRFALFRLPGGNIQLVVRFAASPDEELFFPPKEFGGLSPELAGQAQEFLAEVTAGAPPLSLVRKMWRGRRALRALDS